MEQQKHKFKVGDRVVYHPVCYGNDDLDGWTGTIVYVDNTRLPYTMRLDDAYGGGMTDKRFSTTEDNINRCWFCREENLERIPKNAKKKEEEDNNDMSTYDWNAEKEEKLAEFVRAGRTHAEMRAYFGITEKQLTNRLYMMRKKDPTLPGGHKKSHEEQTDEQDAADNQTGEQDAADNQTGELNDLEQVMSETISELKQENDNLKGTIQNLESSLCKANEENTKQKDEICSLTEQVANLKAELHDTAVSLKTTESQLDEANDMLRRALAELKKTKDRLQKTEEYMGEQSSLIENHVETIQNLNLQRNKYAAKIDALEEELHKSNSIVLRLVEKHILGEGVPTNES